MMTKTEIKQETKKGGIDLDKILNSARGTFSKNEKGLALQMTSGSNITRPTKDSEFVLYPGEHWQALTGVRGIPFGKFVQIAGKPDSGKSSHAMAFMKSAQDAGHIVVLWDAENKFSPNRFDNYFKGDSNQLLSITSKVILTGGDMVVAACRAAMSAYPDKKVLVVWDSVGGTLSTAENTKNLRESRQMAIAAKENGQVLHAWVNLMEEVKDKDTNEERVAGLLINQTYANIGSVGQKESGGQKVEYHSSIILQLTRKGDLNKVRDGIKRKTGILTRAKVRKNHLFDGEDSIAELDLEVLAGSIRTPSKKLKESDDGGWDEDESESEE
jgi:RecA/RadA recombinase